MSATWILVWLVGGRGPVGTRPEQVWMGMRAPEGMTVTWTCPGAAFLPNTASLFSLGSLSCAA